MSILNNDLIYYYFRRIHMTALLSITGKVKDQLQNLDVNQASFLRL